MGYPLAVLSGDDVTDQETADALAEFELLLAQQDESGRSRKRRGSLVVPVPSHTAFASDSWMSHILNAII